MAYRKLFSNKNGVASMLSHMPCSFQHITDESQLETALSHIVILNNTDMYIRSEKMLDIFKSSSWKWCNKLYDNMKDHKQNDAPPDISSYDTNGTGWEWRFQAWRSEWIMKRDENQVTIPNGIFEFYEEPIIISYNENINIILCEQSNVIILDKNVNVVEHNMICGGILCDDETYDSYYIFFKTLHDNLSNPIPRFGRSNTCHRYMPRAKRNCSKRINTQRSIHYCTSHVKHNDDTFAYTPSSEYVLSDDNTWRSVSTLIISHNPYEATQRLISEYGYEKDEICMIRTLKEYRNMTLHMLLDTWKYIVMDYHDVLGAIKMQDIDSDYYTQQYRIWISQYYMNWGLQSIPITYIKWNRIVFEMRTTTPSSPHEYARLHAYRKWMIVPKRYTAYTCIYLPFGQNGRFGHRELVSGYAYDDVSRQEHGIGKSTLLNVIVKLTPHEMLVHDVSYLTKETHAHNTLRYISKHCPIIDPNRKLSSECPICYCEKDDCDFFCLLPYCKHSLCGTCFTKMCITEQPSCMYGDKKFTVDRKFKCPICRDTRGISRVVYVPRCDDDVSEKPKSTRDRSFEFLISYVSGMPADVVMNVSQYMDWSKSFISNGDMFSKYITSCVNMQLTNDTIVVDPFFGFNETKEPPKKVISKYNITTIRFHYDTTSATATNNYRELLSSSAYDNVFDKQSFVVIATDGSFAYLESI